MIDPAHRASFAEHAAPSAIEHQLRQAKARRRQAQRDIEWLAELAGRRAAEEAAGLWPPRAEAAAGPLSATVTAQEPSAGGNGWAEAAETPSAGCARVGLHNCAVAGEWRNHDHAGDMP